jgi:hypothetical protein
MGPDEFATREELGLMVRLLSAKLAQQTEVLADLIDLLRVKGIITTQDMSDASKRLKDSPHSKRASEYVEKLREFVAIHQTARQYLDHPEE